jgi:hypothetical protein
MWINVYINLQIFQLEWSDIYGSKLTTVIVFDMQNGKTRTEGGLHDLQI